MTDPAQQVSIEEEKKGNMDDLILAIDSYQAEEVKHGSAHGSA